MISAPRSVAARRLTRHSPGRETAVRLMSQPAVHRSCRLMSTRPAWDASGRLSLFRVSPREAFLDQAACAELTLEGEIDLANYEHIAPKVEDLCRAGFRRIEIDMDAVTFIDCSAVHAFVNAFERARQCGCTMVLTRVRARQLRVLQLLELDTVLVGQARRSG
jgi:anti-anti-sigma factor